MNKYKRMLVSEEMVKQLKILKKNPRFRGKNIFEMTGEVIVVPKPAKENDIRKIVSKIKKQIRVV